MSESLAASAQRLAEMIERPNKIVILQADNIDADSLATALALESILHDLGKDPVVYCGAEPPSYLRYISGWDRVMQDLPKQFDMSIIVDASTLDLFEKLKLSGQLGWLTSKPCAVIDHHASVSNPIDFAEVNIVEPTFASTGDIVYTLAKELGWPLSDRAQNAIAISILGDTQGLTNNLATSQTYRTMAELIEAGVDRPKLEEERRAFSKMTQEIYRYKAELIKRTEFSLDGRLAVVVIPQNEIHQYSPLYNPGPLIQPDILQVEGVEVAIVLKHYTDRITAAIRCSAGAPIADKLAMTFNGGGHAYASGFKITDDRNIQEVIQACIVETEELLSKR